jgi:hypothetical protein
MADVGKEKIAYLAGIIDGEGCIYLGESKGKFNSTLTVEMACISVPKWIQDNFGGSLYSRIRKDRFKTMWMWRVSSKVAANILSDCYDYLVEKKLEADIFLKFTSVVQYHQKIKLTNNDLNIRRLYISDLRNNRKKQ